MIQTGFESRIKVQDLIDHQLPEFILEESPNAAEFLKQYYISQEYQGGPIDISDNLDQYLKLDNLKPEVIVDSTKTSASVTPTDTTISVSSTKGFPNQYGLLKIDDEIITYTGITTNSFNGCVRGFSGITACHQDLNREELVFSTSTSAEHSDGASVQNLSSLFLKDFYKKLKFTFTPGLEDIKFVDEIDAGNFIRRAKDFYASKGTDEAIKILFKVIFGETPSIINLEEYLIKPSSANYVRREVAIAELISGEPSKIVGQTLLKSTDENTSASISSVEPFSRKGKTFYKIEFYIGNTDDSSSVQGNFEITPNTKLIESVSVGSSILTVDSTLSFSQSGTLVSGTNTISYTGKSINQFFGCTGIIDTITTASNIRSDDTYFSYEDGDTSKKVELILLGVIQDLVEENEDFKVDENDIVVVKNLGDKIRNTNSNWKEIFANSFIYNTSTRYQIVDNSSTKLGSDIDRSSLKEGDEVEILERGNETVIFSSNTPYIQDIDTTVNSLSLINKPNLDPIKKYDVRRKLNKTKSSGSDFGSSSVLSDILNVYVEKDEYAYVASNSLPSEEKNGIVDYRLDIETNIKKVSIASTNNLTDISEGVYNTIEIDPTTEIPFLNGDKIFYSPENESLVGLQTGNYYIKVVSSNKFRLYNSPVLIDSGSNVTFQVPNSGIGTHTFTLDSQIKTDLGIQKLLRKFPLEKNIENGSGSLTTPGNTGMLINGVEISNYKSNDVIYYGPIEGADILSGGEDFDVINPPLVEVSTGAGTTAKIQPVVSGGFEKVYVDSQDYNIGKITSINISGGNGSGAVIEPVIIERPREVLFNSDEFSSGGGVSESTNQILFLTDHNFVNGQEVVYNSLGNNPISIGTAGNNIDLPTNSTYFVGVTNNKAIKLYNTLSDQQLDTNVVGIYTGSVGTHKFSTLSSSKQVSYIKVIDKGEGYTNRKLIVSPTGISTANNTVTFKNHGFNDGEIIEYDYESGQISGITTTNQYFVLKVDDDSFRLCDAGIGGTVVSNYERHDYETIDSTGSGYQYFKYPDISVSIKYNNVGFGTTTQQNNGLVVTPVVKGSVIDAYVYEAGTGYGSTILNLEKKPLITIKNGKNAQLTPSIVDGKIVSVFTSFVGSEYYSVPELIVSGSGTGAELRAIINNGKITEVKVLNSGTGYSTTNTKIQVVSSGKNSFIDPHVRKLTLNNNTSRFSTGEVLLEGKDKLQYSVSKYFDELRNSFKEDPTSISHIIGWAYDGNPIYGPYGYTDPENISSGLKSLESGYTSNLSNVEDRPSGFDIGFFVEDYKFKGDGDLDEYNGRYEINEEYPNGVYVYHATINQFPYFIGNKYKSKLIPNSNLDQSFDFNNSNLLRNTLPYKVSELNADYDFINETSDVLNQKIEVVSVTSDSANSVEIENSGSNYKVGDRLIFDNTGTSGSGLDVSVASIKGKSIVDLNTNSSEYLNSIFTWDSSDRVKVSILPNHILSNLDYVTISGFSTNLSTLNGTHQITVPSYTNGRCISTIASATIGFTTEIYVSPIPDQVSVGSSIGIGTETLKVLEVFKNQNILRIERGSTGISHTVGTAVSFLPDSFTIAKSVDKFDSKVNDKAFFNPKESVGVGTISGVGYSTSFTFGEISSVSRSIPTKGIYIENHPFVTNQPVVYTADGTTLTVSTDGTSVPVSIPSNLFIVKKGPSIIGLKTSIGGEELFFHTNGDDNDQYSFESNYTQIFGDVDKNVVTVSVSTSHELQNGDTITLDVQPNLSVGIGTSTAVRVLYKSEIDNIVVNPIGFNSTGINTVTDEITITNHKLVTGDKVLYEDSGYKEYFVYKINRNKINLCETLIDSQQNPPTVVSFASTGSSSQSIALINPQLQPVKNNNLVFDLSDSSLVNYSLRLYQDKEFNNEFVSTGSTNTFSVSGVGTVGVTSTATLTLDYNSQIGELFYTLEKDSVLVKSDTDVNNYSSIKYVDSDYKNTYVISGVAATTFDVNINKKPEKLSYGSIDCDTLKYSTTSTSPSGPVKTLSIISSGTGYKKLPSLKSTNSVSGLDLVVNAKSKNVGSIKESRVVNNRFTYSSDKTIRPKVNVSPNILLKDSNTLSEISIIRGGEGYVSPPFITLINSKTRSVINSGFIETKITGSAISSLEIKVQPKGLPDDTVEVFATNNNNGVAIEKVESSNTGIFTCIISTPGIGNTFNTPPFADGDEVFIEGVSKFSSGGDGFNSSDYGYRFFKVTNYDSVSGINDKVTINIEEFTTNTGIAKTIQDFSGVIINKNDYPTFKVVQEPTKFLIGETLSSNNVIIDLKVTGSDVDSLKVLGTYELSVGEIITGNESGNVATISSLSLNEGTLNVGYSNLKNIGWDTETGKLSEDFQVTPDNDYYQNLSYSVKSSVTYKDQQSPVESLVHTSGLKNFANTGITSNTSAGLSTSNEGITIIYDVIDEKRVDTINNFDNVIDIDVVDSKSKFLKLKSKKLTNYTELKNLNVLTVDDLQKQFSNSESESTEFLLVDELDNRTYFNYLMRVSSEDGNELQLTDVTILKNELEAVIVENESVSGQEFNYGIFDLFTDETEKTFLRFVPNDAFNTNYDLKVIKQIFNTDVSGVGTQSIGFVNLTGSVVAENTNVGIGTTTIISLNSNDFESLYVNAQVTNTVTNDMNYVRLYVSIDGTNSYMSEYYIDDDVLSSSTGNQIGIFTCTSGGGVLSLLHENTSSDELKIRTNIVGFGTTSTGIGTYRFKSSDQFDGQERSIIYDSGYYSTVGASSTTIQSLDRSLFNASKSLIQVSIGSTKALHQVMMIDEGSNVYTEQLPFLSVSNDDILDDASGIGTFGGEITGSDLILKFYPDANQTGQIDIEVFSKSFYSELDVVNEPLDLSYGAVTESIEEKLYNAINLSRINKDNFELTDNGIPIFSKKFNPNSSALDASTGIFTIQNHFFVTGEELIYTPNSTIVGVGTSAVVTSSGELPSTVYAIKLTENTFKVAITTTAAANETGVTFTGLGEGNAHRFTMKERNSKCILTVDELVQYPLAPTKITHTLSGNIGGSISNSTSFVSLSGISTINPTDILKVDEEYMGITNVGLGTTNVGPITNSGNINLVEVKRGFVGSSASTHTDSTLVRIYKGSFNIEDSEIYFAEAPRGNPQILKTKNNLDFETSSFTGRVFLKSNYENNKIYDDLSDEFTGIGRTFTLKVGGANTTGIGTEGSSGLVFVNNIYQSPKTDNNPSRFNYEILEDTNVGITTLEFSGITRPDDPLQYVVSDYDVNVNEVPRGGIIVSYGSTPGLGFAPLVGASVTAVVGAGGSIVSVGLGTTGQGSGYNGLVSIGVTVYEDGHSGDVATITANIGVGGTLSFNVVSGGTNYSNPEIFVSDPSYSNLPIIGVSRLGIGATTDTGDGLLLDLKVSGSTGIGSTLFEVSEVKFSRPGYNFRRGDVFKPVGLVTDGFLSSPLSDFEITVIDTYSDNFAAWEFGELDYIDSIQNLQDGSRVRFPLNYNSALLSFEPESDSAIEKNINNVLIIFVNGVLQKPVENYIFEGGTSFVFTRAPLPQDEIEIYFYKGVDGTDSTIIDGIIPTIETGDIVQVISNNIYPDTITQDERTVYNITTSDKFETNRYSGLGVDETNNKPLTWTKQKTDKKINGQYVYKSRDVLEPLIFPTAKIIKDVSTTDTEIFVDNVELFKYESSNGYTDSSTPFDAVIIEDTNPVTALFTASIGIGTTVSSITTTNSGFGYLSDQTTIELKFTSPLGVGTTATATASITNGVVTGTTITNPGSGYTVAPTIFAETPNLNIEKITGFGFIEGFSGIVTGITTTSGIGVPLALQFTVIDSNEFSGLSTGYPIYIYDTQIGSGVTSIDNSNSAVVGIGTTFLDNVYYISDWSNSTTVGILTCNVDSNSNIVGLVTTGNILNPVGKYSWGRFSDTGTLVRGTNPISIGVTGNTVSGLTTYPTIQRRGIGIRQTGALPKIEN